MLPFDSYRLSGGNSPALCNYRQRSAFFKHYREVEHRDVLYI
jgi:hypothetical protein